jgi:PAS domain S-box-containing protein
MAANKPDEKKPIRLLLLEDSQEDAALVLRTLTRSGLDVEGDVVGTEREFKELVRFQVHDLILCDFSLPGWNGQEALRWVRASGFMTPFLYVSGTLGEDLAVECLKLGATDYIVKDRLGRLPAAVRRALHEEEARIAHEEAVKKLHESEERLAIAFRSTPEGIAIINLPEGRYVEANDAFLKMLELECGELIGLTGVELGIWVDLAERAALLQKLQDVGAVKGQEIHFYTRSKQVRIAEVSAERILLQGEPCLLAIARDVTDLKSLERQFQQAQKMEAVGRLAGGVAHDFNNLLMIINGCTQLMKDVATDPVKVVEFAEMIEDASDKAVTLTRQLLAFSRQQVLQPTILDLNDVVADLWKMLPRLIGEDIEMKRDLQAGLWNVSADRGQLEQIIMNLAVNARDAMPRGGSIKIQTANVELDRAYGQRHGADVPAGSHVMLAVGDTGEGMTDDVQARIFEPFFTTKGVGKGTGLGLATVYGIVRQSKGHIWVYSEVGSGSVFKIYLPRVEVPDAVSAAPPPAQMSIVGTETILLVEDMDALREFTAKYLESCGYTVLEARRGDDAVEICSGYPEQIHVLITDLVMPGQGGIEVATEVLSLRPGVQVILVSGYTDRDVVGELSHTKAIFLQKPFSMDFLARQLRLLLDGNIP